MRWGKSVWWDVVCMKRTPRHFDGIRSPSKNLKDLLPDVLKGIERRAGSDERDVLLVWAELMGPKMAPLTKAISLNEGVLIVEVKSTTLYSCLCQYERGRLLKSLQEKCPNAGIVNLHFRRR